VEAGAVVAGEDDVLGVGDNAFDAGADVHAARAISTTRLMG